MNHNSNQTSITTVHIKHSDVFRNMKNTNRTKRVIGMMHTWEGKKGKELPTVYFLFLGGRAGQVVGLVGGLEFVSLA